MIIRELTEEDLKEFRSEITKFIYENLTINLPFIKERKELADEKYFDIVKYKQDGSAILYGAIEERLTGFMWAYERNVFGEKRLHLEHLVVSENVRGGGIGSKLIEKLYEEALRRQVSKVELLTTAENGNAVNFYKKHGYSIERVQMELEVREKNVD